MSASTVVSPKACDPSERINLRTGAKYLEALNDGRRVVVNGQHIYNVAAHPLTRRYAKMVADWYDVHHDPAHRDQLTFVDTDGVRRALMWFRQTDKDGLKQRYIYHEYLYRRFGAGMFARMPDTNNGIFLTFADDPEPWARNSVGVDSSGFTDNIRCFWEYIVDNNLNVTPTFIDPPVDRSRPEAEAESPNCRVVERRAEGIVVNGIKATATVSMYADFLMTGAFWRPGITADQVFYAAIRTNSPGVTILSREALTPENIDAEDHPFIAMGDELDNMVIFDNVLVPWERVFHVGNPEHAKEYPQRLFDWIHFADLIRLVVKAELFAGLGLLVGDSSGLLRLPRCRRPLGRSGSIPRISSRFCILCHREWFHDAGGHV
jgi:aromatic ring hydroxylase